MPSPDAPRPNPLHLLAAFGSGIGVQTTVKNAAAYLPCPREPQR